MIHFDASAIRLKTCVLMMFTAAPESKNARQGCEATLTVAVRPRKNPEAVTGMIGRDSVVSSAKRTRFCEEA